ncbi:MAG: hypothetical protein IJG07_06320 [Prevotella sp.]|nr:hypothetical protein [Prevotella sp.]
MEGKEIMLIFATKKQNSTKRMDVKKVTYEEALARFKHSLEVKRAAEKRIAEEWARRGLTGTIVSL